MNSIIHNFTERLEYSMKLSDEPSWVHFYQRLWPEMLSCVRIDGDSKWQRWGIDRLILLPNGKQLLIDEKKRSKTFDDFLCEEWSVVRNGRNEKVGWTLDADKRCDLIAYAIPEIGKCYLLPYELLRITSKEFLNDWKREVQSNRLPCYPWDIPNNGYFTRNCVVSWDRLFRDMRRIMHRSFGKSLSLPHSDQLMGQAVFNY